MPWYPAVSASSAQSLFSWPSSDDLTVRWVPTVPIPVLIPSP
jgi:hypothetical protein